MNPSRQDVHVDRPLTNISVAYMQDASHFIARGVFPNVPVMKQSDRYFVYDRGDFNRDEAEKRAPGTESAGSGYRLDNTPTYFADVWAWHKDVPWQIAVNQDIGDAYDDAARFTMQKLMIRSEAEFASSYMTTGVWATDITGVGSSPATGEVLQWNDASSTPIEDVEAGKKAMLAATGFEPNTLTLGYGVWSILKDHPDIVDRIKYSGGVGNDRPARVTLNALAQLFELDRVLVSKAVVNSAAEEITEASDFILGNKALLSYRPPSPGLLVPSAGYTFSWSGYLGTTNEFGIATQRFPIRKIKSDRVEGEMAHDMKVVSSDLGYFWNSIVA